MVREDEIEAIEAVRASIWKYAASSLSGNPDFSRSAVVEEDADATHGRRGGAVGWVRRPVARIWSDGFEEGVHEAGSRPR